jgi:hypothetical protein
VLHSVTASSRNQLKSLPLSVLRRYVTAYDIPVKGPIDKNDLVDAIIAAKVLSISPWPIVSSLTSPRHQQVPFHPQTNPTIALMVFQSTVLRAPEGSLALVLHPQLNNKRSHHHHLTFLVLTSTPSRHHTEPIPPTPQDSARHPLRRPSPSPLRLIHKRRLDLRPTSLHARLQRLLPPRLLRAHQPHLSHHLSHPRRNPRPHSLLSLRCPRRPSHDYPFTH